jgi:predicted AlkP superfamily phosphohydrolase/phosphomutase
MQVLVIGIDSLDPHLLEKFAPDLPHLTHLRQESPPVEMVSIFPPDSIPAWISIFTGLNPAEHGLVYVFDVFQSQWQDILSTDTAIFRGRTFWDRASALGKRVCVLFPLMAFPPWPVNGIMVSRATDHVSVPGELEWVVEREVQVYPPEARTEFDVPVRVRGVSGSPPEQSDLGTYADRAQAALLEEARLGLRLCQNTEWDLFFITISLLDTIQHLFWRYMDENDPSYPGPNPHQDTIRETYRLLDGIVGEFLRAHPDAVTIVLSDHGHGMRPPRTVNVNEFLRQKGYLVPKGNALNPVPYVVENLKHLLLNIVHRFELDHLLLRLTKTRALSSISKNVYMSSGSIDFDKSQAYLSSFAGPKSYTHGGIEINAQVLEDGEYENLRAALIEDLSTLRRPETGEMLVEWAIRREDLYVGEHVSTCYPDIVFELKAGYGTYWGIHSGLIGESHEHNLSSGGHAKDAVFLLFRSERPVKRAMQLMDVYATILGLLGLE